MNQKRWKMEIEEKPTSAGKWSVALACIPLSVIILLLILLTLSVANASAESRLASLFLFGLIILIGLPIILVTSSIGLVLGIIAFNKSQHKNGKVGLVLNILLVFATIIAIGNVVISFYAD